MDREQQERFREAVDRKSEEARERSHHSPDPGDHAQELPDQQASVTEPGRPQDTFSVRDKNAGKGKKTADKWNQ